MNKSQITQKILSELHARNERQLSDNALLIAKELDTSPEFKKLDTQIRTYILDIAKAEFENHPQDKINALQKKLDILEKKHSDYLAKILPKANSQTEQDIQYLVKQEILKQSGLPSSDFEANANLLSDTSCPPELGKIYSQLQKYYEKFPNTAKQNIIFIGGTGTGKTYAAQALGHALIKRDVAVLYITAFNLVNRFKSYIFDRDSDAFGQMLDAELLIIDDLGTEPIIPNITEENLFILINERIINSRPFIITTNLTPSGLFERYDDRIAGRILSKESSAVFNFISDDLRLKSK